MCPFSPICNNNCYKCVSQKPSCSSISSLPSCIISSVKSIKTRCDSSYSNSISGKKSQIVPTKNLCFWELDNRKSSEKNSYLSLYFPINITVNLNRQMIWFSLFPIRYLKVYLGLIFIIQKAFFLQFKIIQ